MKNLRKLIIPVLFATSLFLVAPITVQYSIKTRPYGDLNNLVIQEKKLLVFERFTYDESYDKDNNKF